MQLKIGKYTLEGGGMCPEQYDVYDGNSEVGYLRLRHGCFSASLTDQGKIWRRVFVSQEMNGDGCFDGDEERMKFLTLGVEAIDQARKLGDL